MGITNQRIRLAIDTAQMGSINDVLTGASPQFWNGVDLEFELGLFRGAALIDISNLDSITVDVKTSPDRTGLPLMSKTLSSGSMDQDLTLDDWNGGLAADSHAVLSFTHAEANLFLSDDSVTFWLVVSALTGDTPAHKIVLGATPITVVEAGAFIPPPSSVVQPTYYTAAQSDARYLLAIDLTSINTHLAFLDTEMTAVTATAAAAMPKTGGTFSGAITITGLSGVLKATAGLVSGSATTTDLTEGSNLYFTNARADARITAQKGAASGLCPLDSGSLIPTAYLPALAIGDVFVVSSQAAMLALSAHQGDIAVRTDINQTFILSNNTPGTLGNWVQILTPASSVTSVNSFTGAVTLTTANISEASNLYYTTARAKADALAAALTGFSSASGGVLSSGDTVLSGLGKLENRTALNDAKLTGSDRVKLDGTTPMTGLLSFTGTGHAGLQLNSLTDTQRAALSSLGGMLIYNSTLSQLQFYNGSWLTLATGSGSTWFNGGGTPSSGVGNNGDYYLNTANDAVWLKAAGSWSAIWAGSVGLAGGTMTGPLIFTGTGNSGLTLSNLTTTQQNALSAGAGTIVYNTTLANPTYWNGSAWLTLASSGSFLALTGGTLSGDLTFSGTAHAGLVVNSLTTAQRNAISAPVNGSIIFNTDTGNFDVYTPSLWNSLGNYLGNTHAFFLTNGTEPITGADLNIGGANAWRMHVPGTSSISLQPWDTGASTWRPGLTVNYGGSGTSVQLSMGGNQLLTDRQTGWTAATGSVTLANLAQNLKALIDDLITHGLIGT